MAKQIPVRQCIGCHSMKAKNELVRIIRTPEGNVILDTTGKQNGRGAYICKSEDCFKKAVKASSISRALKVEITDDVLNMICEELK